MRLKQKFAVALAVGLILLHGFSALAMTAEPSELTSDETTGTIVDEANESSLTFGVVEVSDDTLELDMGEIGKATITAATKEEVLETIKNTIDNYTHVA